YLLPCSCGQQIRVGVAQAGAQIVCACGRKLRVPTMRGLRELKVAPAVTAGATKPGWSSWHGAAFALGLLSVVAGIALIGYNGGRYSQLRFASATVRQPDGTVVSQRIDLTADRSADFAKAAAAEIDRMTPIEALAEWKDDIEKGLGEREEPFWITA